MKPMFKENEKFFHPDQNIFVMVDKIDFYPNKGGYLYTLKCFNHDNTETKPWKRYYESKVLSELVPLKTNNAGRVIFGSNKNAKKSTKNN